MIILEASNRGLSYTIYRDDIYLGSLLFDSDTESFQVRLDSRPYWVTTSDLKVISKRVSELEERLRCE